MKAIPIDLDPLPPGTLDRILYSDSVLASGSP